MEGGSEHLCYLSCNFCSTILAVSVPRRSLFSIVTVKCGHCTNLLSVNMGGLLESLPHQVPAGQNHSHSSYDCHRKDSASSSTCREATMISYAENEARTTSSRQVPEKRQRVPSAYNRFIREEIQRIKARNPEIGHREAFSTAAKNWAHFPHIHFGLMPDNRKQAKMADEDEDQDVLNGAEAVCNK